DNNSLVATRLWWVLNYYGHTNAKVLNGGWHRWLTENRPITFHQTHPQPATFTPRPNESLICRIDDLKAKLNQPGRQVMDMRTGGEAEGTNDRGHKRVRH